MGNEYNDQRIIKLETSLFVCRKKPYEIVEQKIEGYDAVIKFHERNRESRFRTKIGLKRILNEINLELDKGQTDRNLEKLFDLQKRISRFV